VDNCGQSESSQLLHSGRPIATRCATSPEQIQVQCSVGGYSRPTRNKLCASSRHALERRTRDQQARPSTSCVGNRIEVIPGSRASLTPVRHSRQSRHASTRHQTQTDDICYFNVRAGNPSLLIRSGTTPRLRLEVWGRAEAPPAGPPGRQTHLSHFGLSTTRLVTDNITSDDGAFSCDRTRCFRNYATLQFQQILTFYNYNSLKVNSCVIMPMLFFHRSYNEETTVALCLSVATVLVT